MSNTMRGLDSFTTTTRDQDMSSMSANGQTVLPALVIVIPALNEEESIGAVISRCLAAREEIAREGRVSRVDLVVVSDGSTDRTAEIARSFGEITTIEWRKNRGYGAAIKEGWKASDADFLGFLDADGTCDPVYFGKFCKLLQDDPCDVVLGSRMGPGSKMPALRRLGNDIFAFILGFVSGVHITDTASGMRVVRRSALRSLLPLPDGLQFTPAMSAHALLNGVRLVEHPMTYEERMGRSKLSVVRDGLRFLQCIIESVLCYRPEKPLMLGAMVFFVGAILLIAYPAEFYLKNRRLEEWMIYRVTASLVFGTIFGLLIQSAALASQMTALGPGRSGNTPFWAGYLGRLFRDRLAFVTMVGVLVVSLWSLTPGIVQLARSGSTDLHWSRLLVGGFLLIFFVQTGVFWLLGKVIAIWRDHAHAKDFD